VRGLPTFILFKDGKPHAQHIGAVSKSAMMSFIDRAI
jgi:thioredoxin 1